MNTYYTKCRREFNKSSNASVTGYKIDVGDLECAKCLFRVKVTKGYPEVFDHWECRAGSQPPSQIDDWRGSVDDKANISIRSLHNDFLESVLEYCESQPDLVAGYNQDLADCRRQISVSCSANKKGMAAKKVLVEKFFNGNTEAPEETAKEKIEKLWDTFVKCEACKHIIDEGDSVEYCKCTKKRGHVKREQTACDKFEPIKLCVECSHCQPSEKGPGHPAPYKCFNTILRPGLDFYFGEGRRVCENFEEKEVKEVKETEKVEEVKTTCKDCNLFGEDNGNHLFVCKHIYPSGNTGTTIPSNKSCEYFEKTVDNVVEETELNACDFRPEGCNAFQFNCCDIKRRTGMNRYHLIREFKKYDIKCPTYKKLEEECITEYGPKKNVNENIINSTKTTESVNEAVEIDTKTSEIVTFDYSTVDDETAQFLQSKTKIITEIRIKSVIGIGKELQEAHDKLASHNKNQGTYMAWVKSLGISWDTANNYIRAYNYVSENFGMMENAKDIQTSLLFAVSKPSAPKELQDQVLSGDITTHKQYKEKETEWKEKIEQYRAQQDALRTEKQQASINAMDAERRADRLEADAEELREEIRNLQNQNNEPQDTELISNLQNRINILEGQLKDKPIETSAVRIVEKMPEKDAAEISLRLFGTLMAAKSINKQEIQIVHDTANDVRRNSIAEFLENLRDMIPGYLDILNDNVSTRKCEQCEFCSWDGLKEADEDNGLILCTQQSASGEPLLIKNDNPCQLFKER